VNTYLAYTIGMISRRPLQYTIRNIPQAIDRALRQKANRYQKSLNEVVLEVLAKGVGVENELRIHHDLDHFFGSWVEDKVMDEVLVAQRQIDKSIWK